MSLPFDIAEVAQPVPQSLQRWPGLIRENADFPKVARRLRSDGSWPRSRRAAEQLDERAASHVAPQGSRIIADLNDITPRRGCTRCGNGVRGRERNKLFCF